MTLRVSAQPYTMRKLVEVSLAEQCSEDISIDLTAKGDKTIMSRDRGSVELWIMNDESVFVHVIVTEANACKQREKGFI